MIFRVPGAMQRFFRAASQNRDPGFFELQATGAPALQRTAARCAASGARVSTDD